jgi:hypothetical protein
MRPLLLFKLLQLLLGLLSLLLRAVPVAAAHADGSTARGAGRDSGNIRSSQDREAAMIIGGAAHKTTSTSAGPNPCVRADGTARASCFGFDATDSTSILQTAFASGASLLTIDDAGNQLPWVVTPLLLENVTDMVVVVEPGVTILAKEGAFHGGGDCLLLLRNCHNVTLTGGAAAVDGAAGAAAPPRGTLKMRREDYADPAKYTKAEWRMAIRLDETAHNITISNLHITESGGDGIFVFGASNVLISGCFVDKHYRQGLSIISARGVLVERCVFADTNGTEPAAGIDIEPDASIHGARPELSNVTIRDCSCRGNAGGGLLMNLAALNSSTPPISISIQNLTVDGQMQHGPGLTIGNVKHVVGNISISNSRVRNTRGCGLAIYKKEAAGAFARLSNLQLSNVAVGYPPRPGHSKPHAGCDPTGACAPILLIGGTDAHNAPAAANGGIVFDGPCVVHDELDRSFLRASNIGFAFEQIVGSFDVWNPESCTVMIQNGTDKPPRPLTRIAARLWTNTSGMSLDTRCHNSSTGIDGVGPSAMKRPFVGHNEDAVHSVSPSSDARVVRAWVGAAQGFWPNCSHRYANCAHNSGALGMIRQRKDVLDGVFLGCEVGMRANGSLYMPADGAPRLCAEAVAAIRAISSSITIQGVVSIISCPLSQKINANPSIFVDSAAAFADRFGFNGLNLNWESCPYYCDRDPIDCGTWGVNCTCSPAGFGTGVARTVNTLGERLRRANRTVTLAIGVLKKGNDGAIVRPPYVYPNVSAPGSLHPTSDITRMLRSSPFLERITDMDTYYQNNTDPMINHPDYFEQCARASQLGFGPKLGVGLGAYEVPIRPPAQTNFLRILQYLDSLNVLELDIFSLDSRPGSLCKTCAPGWAGPTPPEYWWPMLEQWKNRRIQDVKLNALKTSDDDVRPVATKPREFLRSGNPAKKTLEQVSLMVKHDDSGDAPLAVVAPPTTNSSAMVYLLLPASTFSRPSDAALLAVKEVRRYIFAATGVLLPLAVVRCAALGDDSALAAGSVLLTSQCAEAAALSGEQHAVQRHAGVSSLVLAADDHALLRAAYRWAELALGVHFGIGGDTVAKRSRGEYERRVAKLDKVASAENGLLFAPAFSTRGIQPFHDFSEGPDLWEAADYKRYLTQMAKLQLNFIGLHSYNYYNDLKNYDESSGTNRGNHAEPGVWQGMPSAVDEGNVNASYTSGVEAVSWQSTCMSGDGTVRHKLLLLLLLPLLL